MPAPAQIQPFATSLRTQAIATNRATIHVHVSSAGSGVVLHSGHWLMEEQPEATVAAVRTGLDSTP